MDGYAREVFQDERWGDDRKWTVEGPRGGLLICYPPALLQQRSNEEWQAWEDLAVESDPNYIPMNVEVVPLPEHPEETPEELAQIAADKREVLEDPPRTEEQKKVDPMTDSEKWQAFLTPKPQKGIEEWHEQPQQEWPAEQLQGWASEQSQEWPAEQLQGWVSEQPQEWQQEWPEQPQVDEWQESWQEQESVDQRQADEWQTLQQGANAVDVKAVKSPPKNVKASGPRAEAGKSSDGKGSQVKWQPLTPDGVANFNAALEAAKDKAEKLAGFKTVLMGMTLEAAKPWMEVRTTSSAPLPRSAI